ncbi:DUF6390 family protein [Mycobacterium sp. 21AC1]|uniref:DUF6390 family protein n=1 Tax=[Mycobacterium] appelbergii TaxID=2939269 RepID=UPI0029390D11|nr:DUF6390 family protein [Mycobacterium sp. 21AC1]MDV3125115.1 DUF6390 family protein [Mycobacterium sp. 21AC1]
MPTLAAHGLPAGHALFVRYAYPPNELGYCGPSDTDALLNGESVEEIESYAREFDGTWPYLRAIAKTAAIADPLDADVVRSYWIGGPLLDRVDAAALLATLRAAFAGQRTGLLTELQGPTGVLAHHSFHVFLVYPWVRFLDKDSTTALNILQNCRIRWGIVESVRSDHALVCSRPLTFEGGVLTLAEPATERIRWRSNDVSLIARPAPGRAVAAHWDWVCDTLTDADTAALAAATQTTLDVVNAARNRRRTGPGSDQ